MWGSNESRFRQGHPGHRRRTRKILSCHMFAISKTSSIWMPFAVPISNLAWIPSVGPHVPYWEPINSIYGLDIAIVNPTIDPTFSFMTVDHDGKIRMDCSSPYAMARLVGLKDQYQVAFAQRSGCGPARNCHSGCGVDEPEPLPRGGHSILAHASPAMAPRSRRWKDPGEQQHDRQSCSKARAASCAKCLWALSGLWQGSSTARAVSAGKRVPERVFFGCDGTVWTTDKDGPIMDLLAAEITARTGKDPGEHYRELTAEFGTPYYTRIDAPATPEQKTKLQELSPDAVKESDLAGEPITAKLTRAPGNRAPIGGLKVVAGSGWFAARPSGTENIYKIYAESFKSEQHLDAIVAKPRR